MRTTASSATGTTANRSSIVHRITAGVAGGLAGGIVFGLMM